MKPMYALMGLCLAAAGTLPVTAQVATAEPDAFAHATQMIVVTTPDWNAIDGQLQRFERSSSHEKWHPAGKPISIVVGRSGMGWGIGVLANDAPGVRSASEPAKKEGDGKSPAGVFDLGTAFGYASQPLPGLKLPYLNLSPSVECVDDVRSKYYNRVLDRSSVAPDWNSSEHMRNAGEAYIWGVVIDHNGTVQEANAHPPVPSGGSCVFMHIWAGAGHGTAGCTAMRQSELEAVLLWLDPKRKPLLVQLPAADYARLSSLWKLPSLISESSR
jgi:L,D-peptidoglycan transpeptidase YkuD (ErfK/YbiS/YcfS/YnhG family)